MGFCSSVGVWDEQTARRFSKCKVKSVLSKGARSPVLLRLGFYRPLVTRAHCPACRAPYTSRGASAEGPTCQCRRHNRLGFDPWVGKIPWKRAGQPTPIFLPGESHGQGSLVGSSPRGNELDTTEVPKLETKPGEALESSSSDVAHSRRP